MSDPFILREIRPGLWALDASVGGRRLRRRARHGDRAAARRWARLAVEAAWRDRLAPAPPRAPTFAEAAAGYMRAGGEARFLRPLLLHFGPRTTVDEIDELAIDAAGEALYPAGSAETRRRQVRVPVRAVIRWARGERRRPSTDNPRIDWIEPETAERPTPKPGPFQRVMDRAFGTGPLLVRGHGDRFATLAKCCEPVPGEELVGYVTRGRGISVHSADCPNVKSLSYDPERMVEVEWARSADGFFPVALSIETEDHTGMLARLTEVIAKESSNIRQFEAEAVEPGRGLIEVVVEVRNRKHLNRLRQSIGRLSGVLRVARRRNVEPRRRPRG